MSFKLSHIGGGLWAASALRLPACGAVPSMTVAAPHAVLLAARRWPQLPRGCASPLCTRTSTSTARRTSLARAAALAAAPGAGVQGDGSAFRELGLGQELVDALAALNIRQPTEIQVRGALL